LESRSIVHADAVIEAEHLAEADGKLLDSQKGMAKQAHIILNASFLQIASKSPIGPGPDPAGPVNGTSGVGKPAGERFAYLQRINCLRLRHP
jgi:hypothetical protein